MSGCVLPSTLSVTLAALIGLVGCDPSRPSREASVLNAAEQITDAQRATIVGSVEQTWAKMMAAARALDPAGIRAGYVDRPTVAINGLILEDFDRQFHETERWLGSLRQLDASYDNVHLEVLSPTAAVATMNHHLRWIDTTGTAGEWNSAWTAVFRQGDGRWKIVYSHESVLPGK